jgi:pyruvate,water dikinase
LSAPASINNVLWLHDLRLTDLAQVGGKNSSLGEMIGELSGLGVSVPGGFATTADAFKAFIAHNDLHARIYDKLATVDVEDVPALTRAGAEIRGWVIDAPLQPELDADIRSAPTRSCARMPARTTSRWRCVPRRPPKTCPMQASPASRKPSST